MQTRHYLRAWRKFRKRTLEAVAHEIGIHLSVLGKIETGKVPYSQTHLESLAVVYKCLPADLLFDPPSDDTALPALLMAIRHLSPPEQNRALALLRAAFDKLAKAA